MSKVKVIDKKSQKAIIFERELLSRIHSSFIVNLIYSFQDFDNLYLVMDFLKGGDLRYHICKNQYITEEQTKFFLACLIIGLEYIHSLNLIHRDIKPENLLMDSKGYLRITDFGISSIYQKNKKNAYDTSGTPGYMAPEVITGNNHCKVVDYFAMGIIGFELMMGERPYKGKTRKEIKEKMIKYQVEISEEDIPIGWSVEAANFFNKLLIREPENRLGFNGINEIKNNEWFSDINFKDLYKKKLKSPYKPRWEENFDKKYCNYEEKNSVMTIERYQEIKNSGVYERIFMNYTYYPLADIKPEKIDKSKQSNETRKTLKKLGKNSKKNSPDKNLLLKNHPNYCNYKYLFKEVFHLRHFSNEIGISSNPNLFIPLSNRKQEIRLNKIHKNFLNDFRLTNNNSDNFLKKCFGFSKSKKKKNKNHHHLTNIDEKNSRSMSFNNKTINNNRSLEKSKIYMNHNEKKLRKEKTTNITTNKPIMKKIKLKLAKNIIKRHIKSNMKINNEKTNININVDNNKNNNNNTHNNINNIKSNYLKLINNNIRNNELIKKNIFTKINSPKTIKSISTTMGMNYIYSAKKPSKKTILNQFNLSNLCNATNINSKNILTLNLNNYKNNNNNYITTTNNNTNNNNNMNSRDNLVHYHKINNNLLSKLKMQKNNKQLLKQNITSKKKHRNKLDKIIENIYSNFSIKTPLNSPTNNKANNPLNNISQLNSQEICNKIIKNKTNFKIPGHRPNKLIKNCQKTDIKENKRIKKINLSSIRNLDVGSYHTKKNSRNKILQLSKFNNVLNNKGNIKISKSKKMPSDKEMEFKLTIPTFPNPSLYNQFLTNQTINITLSNCFNNSTINEKKDKLEGVKPFHRRYASINYPNSNNLMKNNTNLLSLNDTNREKKTNSKTNKRIK